MPKYFFAILFLSFITGCNKQNGTQKEQQATVKADSVKNEIKPGIYEGIYNMNKHTNTFIDCSNSDSVYFVIDETNKLEDQYDKMFGEKSVYNSVVLKVKGEVETTSNLTEAEKYPRTLRVKEVISIEKKNFRNTCVPYDFWALGNEPNWSLEISKKENLIEFILPGESKSYYFFYSEPLQENGYIVYRNHNPIQRYLIDIKIRKEPCSDTMSDISYKYSAEVELSDKRVFKGCGIKWKE